MSTVEAKSKIETVAEFLTSPEALGMTDEQVATRLGVGRSTVYHARKKLADPAADMRIPIPGVARLVAHYDKDGHPVPDIRMVPTAQIIIDERFQAREGHDAAQLGRYREMFREGMVPPALIAFESPEGYVVVDGFGTYWAAEQEGIETLPVDVRRGTEEDMYLAAAAANADHGAPRTDRTIENALRMVLDHVEDAKTWPAERLAAAVKTTLYRTQKFLRSFKAPGPNGCLYRLDKDALDPAPDPVVFERNGKAVTMDRSKITGRPKKAAPEPAAEETPPVRAETPEETLDLAVASILDRSPLYGRLAPACKKVYRLDVRAWLEHRETYDRVHAELKKLIGRHIKGEPLGQFITNLEHALRLPHPCGGLESAPGRHDSCWLGCNDCLRDGIHTGKKPDGRNNCGSCSGRGYSIPGAH